MTTLAQRFAAPCGNRDRPSAGLDILDDRLADLTNCAVRIFNDRYSICRVIASKDDGLSDVRTVSVAPALRTVLETALPREDKTHALSDG